MEWSGREWDVEQDAVLGQFIVKVVKVLLELFCSLPWPLLPRLAT